MGLHPFLGLPIPRQSFAAQHSSSAGRPRPLAAGPSLSPSAAPVSAPPPRHSLPWPSDCGPSLSLLTARPSECQGSNPGPSNCASSALPATLHTCLLTAAVGFIYLVKRSERTRSPAVCPQGAIRALSGHLLLLWCARTAPCGRSWSFWPSAVCPLWGGLFISGALPTPAPQCTAPPLPLRHRPIPRK